MNPTVTSVGHPYFFNDLRCSGLVIFSTYLHTPDPVEEDFEP